MVRQLFPQSDSRWIANELPIWRYVPLRTLFFYLNGLIYIPSVSKLRAGDPFEGEFYEDTPWFNTAFKKCYQTEAESIKAWMLEHLCSQSERDSIAINKGHPDASAKILQRHYFEFVRKTRFAWCWFHSYRESAAMWSVYGNQGVAVKTTVGRALRALEETGRDFIYGRMTYLDYQSGVNTQFNPEQESDFGLLLRTFFLKRSEYKSEEEIRFVTTGAERRSGGILLRDVKPTDWIQVIRLWPGLADSEEKSLCRVIEYLLPNVDCSKSNLFSQTGAIASLVESLMDDLEKSDDSNWQEGKDNIPNLLKTL